MSIKPSAIVVAAVIGVAGCSSLGTSSTPASGGSSAPLAASPSSPDCGTEAVSWRDSGGKAQLGAFTADLDGVQKADVALAGALGGNGDLSAAEANLQSAAAALQSDAQAAEANLPPACVPRLREDYGAALTDYSKAAADCQNAVSELSSGSYDVAGSDLKTASAAENAGNRKLSAAAADLNAFNNS